MGQQWRDFLNNVRFLKILIFNDSRKSGLGLWLLILGTIGLLRGIIISDQYMTILFLVTALMGGGTIADKWMENKSKKIDAEGKTNVQPATVEKVS